MACLVRFGGGASENNLRNFAPQHPQYASLSVYVQVLSLVALLMDIISNGLAQWLSRKAGEVIGLQAVELDQLTERPSAIGSIWCVNSL